MTGGNNDTSTWNCSGQDDKSLMTFLLTEKVQFNCDIYKKHFKFIYFLANMVK